jgi:hypothetical protein
MGQEKAGLSNPAVHWRNRGREAGCLLSDQLDISQNQHITRLQKS